MPCEIRRRRELRHRASVAIYLPSAEPHLAPAKSGARQSKKALLANFPLFISASSSTSSALQNHRFEFEPPTPARTMWPAQPKPALSHTPLRPHNPPETMGDVRPSPFPPPPTPHPLPPNPLSKNPSNPPLTRVSPHRTRTSKPALRPPPSALRPPPPRTPTLTR